MNPLIKSTRVDGQPVVLSRIRKCDAVPSGDSAALCAEQATAANGISTDMPAFPTAAEASAAYRETTQAEQVTYEEYKLRFEDELQALERQARLDGFDKGLAEGRERGAAEHAEELQALARLIASARQSLDRAIDGLSEIGIEIACEATAKIIGQAMMERDVVVAVVREVIRRAKDRTQLIVRVSPPDWAMLEGCREQLTEGLNIGSVEIVADERVQLGGCLLETPTGSLDGRLEVQLERLRDVLLNAKPEMCTETEAAA